MKDAATCEVAQSETRHVVAMGDALPLEKPVCSSAQHGPGQHHASRNTPRIPIAMAMPAAYQAKRSAESHSLEGQLTTARTAARDVGSRFPRHARRQKLPTRDRLTASASSCPTVLNSVAPRLRASYLIDSLRRRVHIQSVTQLRSGGWVQLQKMTRPDK